MNKLSYSITNYLRNIDIYTLIISFICSIYGLVLVYSATLSLNSNKFIIVQAFAIFIGLIAFVICSLLDVENISNIWKIIFVINLVFLGSVLFFGTSGDTGNNSWIRFAGIGVQPGEIGKILFIITFSKHTAILKNNINNWKSLLQLAMHAGIVLAFIVIFSGDAGMALAYVIICITILFISGLSYKWFAGAILSILASIPLIWNYVLKEYQKTRILVTFDPSIDPDKAYQALQSKLAIGSGQIYGTGFMSGNQTQFGSLPAKHTDFIFAVAGEEFGFIGASLIVLLLMALIARLFYVSYKAEDDFTTFVCAGIGGMMFFQAFENIFMCLGVMPVIGLTLPFFSYGGSSIVTMFTAVGIVAGIRMRQTRSFLK